MASTKKEIKAYIDTSAWIAYINAELFSGKKYKKAKFAVDLFKLLSKKNTPVLFSYFNLIELTEVLRDTLINLRLLGEGYSVHNLSRVKKEGSNNKLTKTEDAQLTKLLAKVTSFKFLEIVDKPEAVDEKLVNELYLLTSNFFIEMPDALHIVYAIKHECNLFITSDKPLITKFREARKASKDFKDLIIRHPDEIVNDPNLI